MHLNYLIATALAVETAVIHNFLWHERFTWADRAGAGFTRFLKFNLTTGLFSIGGNLLLMKLLVGLGHMNYLLANGIRSRHVRSSTFWSAMGLYSRQDRTETQSM